MRVAFLAGTLGRGGAERQLYYMLRALKGAGADVRLLSLTSGEEWEQPIRELGVPVEWVGQRRGKATRLLRTARAVHALKPDIVQSAHFYTNLYVVGAARMTGCREIGAIRSDAVREVRANGWLGRPSLALPRRIAANSRGGLENAVRLGVPRKRLHLLPNVVDERRFRPSPRPGKDVVTLLCAGRLIKSKRVDRFISIVARVRKLSCVPVRALVVGDGPERATLQAHPCAGGVEFRGMLADPAPAYAEADVHVLTSDQEGSPNVVLEAMACGLPVVATRAGGTVDLVEEGVTGYLFDCDDEEGMAQALAVLVEDARLRDELGGYARARIERDHAVGRLPGFLEELYMEVLR